MSLLPIVSRELRVSSRKGATYWTRVTTALGAIAVAAFTWLMQTHSSARETGLFMFVAMSVIAYAHCLFTGLMSTADSLSEEKREGTLGLLFLTDLKGYDVVFGKLFATSLKGFYGLLAIFPVLGIALLLGGVALGEFARVMLTCVNCLFLSLSLGMLTSALCRDERKSMTLACLIMLLLTAGLPALGGWMMFKLSLNSPPLAIFGPSPGYACFMAFDSPFKSMGNHVFYQSILIQHLMAWGALLTACVLVPRSWQDKALSVRAEGRRATWRQWTFGSPEMRLTFRRGLLAVNPYYWVVSRDRFKQATSWLWLTPFAVVWLIGLAIWPNDWREPGAYVFTAVVLHGLFKNLVAMEAARRLGLDRRSGAMELILCTPMEPRDIIRGQWLGLMRQFLAPAALIVLVDLVFLAAGWPSRHGQGAEWLLMWMAGISIFVLDLAALGALGMWFGLRQRRANQASLQAMLLIGVVPWVAYAGCTATLAILEKLRIVPRLPGRIEAPSMILAWWVLSVGISVGCGLLAHRRLQRDFQDIVAGRAEGVGAAVGRWLGRQRARLKARVGGSCRAATTRPRTAGGPGGVPDQQRPSGSSLRR